LRCRRGADYKHVALEDSVAAGGSASPVGFNTPMVCRPPTTILIPRTVSSIRMAPAQTARTVSIETLVNGVVIESDRIIDFYGVGSIAFSRVLHLRA
jgi:hypothetical protein